MNDPLKTSMRSFAERTVTANRESAEGSKMQCVQPVALTKLRKSPYQPRLRTLKKSDVSELMGLMEGVGLTTPIVVSPNPDEEGTFHVHQGERRWVAAHHLGWTEIAAIVRVGLSAKDARKTAVADNLGRDDLTAFEQAKALADYQAASGLLFEDAAQDLGVSRPTAFRLKNILGCSERLQEILRESDIAVTTAALLAKLETQDTRGALRMAAGCRDGSISRAAVEEAIAVNRTKPTRPKPAKKDVEIKASEQGIELRVSWSDGRSTEENKVRIVRALGEVLQRINVRAEDAVRTWQQPDA